LQSVNSFFGEKRIPKDPFIIPDIKTLCPPSLPANAGGIDNAPKSLVLCTCTTIELGSVCTEDELSFWQAINIKKEKANEKFLKFLKGEFII